MNKNFRRITALFAAAAITLGSFPVDAFAQDTEGAIQASVTAGTEAENTNPEVVSDAAAGAADPAALPDMETYASVAEGMSGQLEQMEEDLLPVIEDLYADELAEAGYDFSSAEQEDPSGVPEDQDELFAEEDLPADDGFIIDDDLAMDEDIDESFDESFEEFFDDEFESFEQVIDDDLASLEDQENGTGAAEAETDADAFFYEGESEEELTETTAPLAAGEMTTPDGKFTYSEINGTYANIVKYNGDGTHVTVPATVGDYIVQTIGTSAFSGNTDLVEVTLPDELVTVGVRAFSGCTSLTSFTAGKNLEVLSEYAFSGCAQLTTVNLSACEKFEQINSRVFSNCTSLETVSLPDTVKRIGYRAFENCTSLNEVNYPEGLEEVPNYLGAGFYDHGGIFYGCTNLKQFTVPAGIDTLPDYLLAGCSMVEEVSLPDTLTVIGANAFQGTTALKQIRLPENLTEIGASAFASSGLTDITLPASVQTLGASAFSNCTSLTEAVLSSAVDTVGYSAFSGCTSLVDVTIPEGIETLEALAFADCTSLVQMELPDSITTFGYRAFRNCTGLTQVHYPGNTASCPNYLGAGYYDNGEIFYGCSSLKSVSVTEGITAVPDHFFKNCQYLENVTLPSTLTQVGAHAFEGCNSLRQIDFPVSFTTLGVSAFKNCSGLRELTVPETVTAIADNAFEGCSGLSWLTLPESVTKIGFAAFRNCTGLAGADLPDSITEIWAQAFSGCTGLREICFPAGLTEVGFRAFESCTSLKKAVINAAWNAAPNYMGAGFYDKGRIFAGCSVLRTIEFTEGMTLIPDEALRGTAAVTKLRLPESLTAIGANSFSECSALEEIWIPESVTSIGTGAFGSCPLLTIHGIEGSYAQTWAEANEIPFSSDPLEQEIEILQGYVLDGNGDGIAGAGICITRRSNFETFLLETDENGYWMFGNAVAGQVYQIRVSAAGYRFVQDTLVVTAQEGTTEVPALTGESFAADLETEDPSLFTYKVLSGSFIEITGYTGTNDRFAIPAVIDGYTVTQIGASAFAGRRDLTDITVPEGVEIIASKAFRESSVASVSLPSTLIQINDSAFEKCTSLCDVSFSGGLKEIWAYAFRGCTLLERLLLPDSVTTIGYQAFASCTSLAEVSIPLQLADLANYHGGGNYDRGQIFKGCTALKQIVVPEGMRTLPARTFQGCADIESIELPQSLQTIGAYAFSGCTMLSSVPLPLSLETIGGYAFENCTAMTEIETPASLKQIVEYAFRNCSGLEQVQLAEGLEDIYAYAFFGCTGLSRLTLPDSVVNIGYRAFQNCTALTEVNLPLSFTECPNYFGAGFYDNGQIFYGCTSLTEVLIPEGIQILPAYTFAGCTSLTKAEFPSTLTEIGANAYSGCSSLAEVSFPQALISIGDGAFQSCSGLSEILLPEQLASIGASAFKGCSGIREVIIPETVSEIMYSTFCNCTGLTDIRLPAGLTTIYAAAFSGCTRLNNVTVPDSVESIGFKAFENCTSLTSIHFGGDFDTPNYLGAGFYDHGYIFSGCTKLQKVTMPEGTTKISDYAFAKAPALVRVNLPDSMTSIGVSAFSSCGELQMIWLGENVSLIGDKAFDGCSLLTIYGMPDSYAQTWAANHEIPFVAERPEEEIQTLWGYVKDPDGNPIAGADITIYRVSTKSVAAHLTTDTEGSWRFDEAVAGAEYLISVSSSCCGFAEPTQRVTAIVGELQVDDFVSDTVPVVLGMAAEEDFDYEVISGSAVSITGYHGTLTSFMIPASIGSYTVTKIGEDAFFRNENIERIGLSEGIESIGSGAFAESSLTDIYLPKTLEIIENSAFEDCADLTKVYMTGGLLEIWAYAFRGCSSLASLQLPDSVELIGFQAFANCVELTGINYPLCLETIANYHGAGYYDSAYIFKNCPKLISIEVPEGVTRLADSAFTGCTDIQELTLPSSLQEIGSEACWGMTSLKEIILPAGLKAMEKGAFGKCSSLQEISIPAGCIEIGSQAFEECTSLTDINLAEGIEQIDAYAFSSCTALEKMEFPQSLTAIGFRAFEYCSSLNDVLYPAGLEECPNYLGAGYYDNGEVFYECPALLTVTIPDGVTRIADHVFKNTDSLTEMDFPDSVTEIGSYAFARDTGLTDLKLPEHLEALGENTFENCTGLVSIDLPDTLAEIDSAAFFKCSSLKKIVLPSSLTVVKDSVFRDCTGMEELVFNENLEEVWAYAFSGVTSLEEVAFPDAVTTLGYRAFYGCTALKDVTLPAGWTETPNYLGAGNYDRGQVFNECTSLRYLELPEGMTTVPRRAFEGNTSLRTVDLASTIQTVEYAAFAGCTGLPQLELNEGLRQIDEKAFQGLDGILSLTIPSTTETVGKLAFEGCINLGTLMINSGVKSLGDQSFANNMKLTSAYIPASVTSFGEDVFDGCPNVVIYCSANSAAARYAIDHEHQLRFYTDGGTDDAVLDRAGTGYDLDAQNAQVNGYITGRVDYTIREDVYERLSDISVSVYVPKGTTLLNNSIRNNGINVSSTISIDGNSFSLPVDARTGSISFTLKPELVREFFSYAVLDYSLDGTEGTSMIGTVSEEAPTISLTASENTTDGVVQVSGIAPPESTVHLLLDGKEQKTVTAKKDGSYKTSLNIYDPEIGLPYEVKAVAVNDVGTEVEAGSYVWYNPEQPKLSEFLMYYNNHQETVKNLLKENTGFISYNPSYPFRFVIDFDNEQSVNRDMVYVQSNKSGVIKTIPAQYDEAAGKYIAEGYFDGNSRYVPGAISVAYNRKRPQLSLEDGQALMDRISREAFGNLTENATVTTNENGDEEVTFYSEVLDNDYVKLIIKNIDEIDKADFKEHFGPDADVPFSFNTLYDIYDVYKYVFDANGEEHWVTIVKNYVDDPVHGTSGLLVMLGDMMGNDVTQMFIEGATDEFTAQIFNSWGKGYKTMGNILGEMVDVEDLRARIMASDYSDERKAALNKELDAYITLRTVYSVIMLGYGLASKEAGPVPYVIYLGVQFIGDMLFDEWKELLEDGLCLFKWGLDPSGYVYEGFEDNPLEGVKATIYYNDGSGGRIDWDAEEYSQVNPLFTNSDGRYAWDVPEGQWGVRFEKDGYIPVDTADLNGWYDVPPVQTDINVNMIAADAPEVIYVSAQDTYAEVVFSQYVAAESVEGIALTDAEGFSIPYTLVYDAKTDAAGTAYAKNYRLEYDDGYVLQTGTDGVVTIPSFTSYNGQTTAAQTKTFTGRETPEVQVPAEGKLRPGDTVKLSGTIANYSGQETVSAMTDRFSVAAVKSVTGPDANGNFTVILEGVTSGTTELTVTINETGETRTVTLTTGTECDLETVDTYDVNDVLQQIENLPAEPTEADTSAVEAAREAYEDLKNNHPEEYEALDEAARQSLEETLSSAEKSVADDTAAQNVKRQILALPDMPAAADEEEVAAAKAAFENLKENNPDAFAKLPANVQETLAETLLAAEQSVADDKAAGAARALIEALDPNADLTDPETLEAARSAAEAAREAYDALTPEQKEKLLQKMGSEEALADLVAALTDTEAAVKEADDTNAANEALNAVNGLPAEPGLENEAQVQAAADALETLTEDQKKKLEELLGEDGLQQLQEKLEDAKQSVADDKAVKAVIAQIEALTGQEGADQEEAVKAARDAYAALTNEQRQKLDDAAKTALEEKLTNAEQSVQADKDAKAKAEEDAATAKAEAEAAQKAAALVNALPDAPGAADEAAVAAARAAYNALSAGQKAKLTEAERAVLETKLAAAEKSVADDKAAKAKAAADAAAKAEAEAAAKAKEEAEAAAKAKAEAEAAAKAKAEEEAAQKAKAEAQAAFRLNVKGGAKNVPIQLKKKNSKIKAVSLADGDALLSAVSSNEKFVTASVSGSKVVLKGLKNKKKATITVTTKLGAVVTFSVKVQKAKVKTKKITAKKSYTLKAGETLDLGLLISPVTTGDKITFKSSKKKVAAVGKKTGLVTAKKTGTAKITITSGKKKKVVKIKVVK